MASRNPKKDPSVASAIRKGGFRVKLSEKILDLISKRKRNGK